MDLTNIVFLPCGELKIIRNKDSGESLAANSLRPDPLHGFPLALADALP